MSNLFTVGFECLEGFYYSLIRLEKKEDRTEYQITVMNGNFEKLLYDNNIIKELNGSLHIEVSNNPEEELKIKLAEALSDFFKVPLEKDVKYDKIY